MYQNSNLQSYSVKSQETLGQWHILELGEEFKNHDNKCSEVIRRRFFTQRVVRQSAGSSGHSPKPVRAPQAFGQLSQTHDGIIGMSWPGAGLQWSLVLPSNLECSVISYQWMHLVKKQTKSLEFVGFKLCSCMSLTGITSGFGLICFIFFSKCKGRSWCSSEMATDGYFQERTSSVVKLI